MRRLRLVLPPSWRCVPSTAGGGAGPRSGGGRAPGRVLGVRRRVLRRPGPHRRSAPVGVVRAHRVWTSSASSAIVATRGVAQRVAGDTQAASAPVSRRRRRSCARRQRAPRPADGGLVREWAHSDPRERSKKRSAPVESDERVPEGKHMSNDAVTTVTVDIAGTEISFETGRLAKQAGGAVLVKQGDTHVLCTATAGGDRDVDFLPLTVEVEERMYAAGKIPGSFFKREGRAGEKGILTARMIDRPIRPLFPKSWRRETQLVAIPMSIDHVHPYDILAMNGASAALMLSDDPGAVPGRRRAHRQDRRQLRRQPVRGRRWPRASRDLDLIVSGSEEAILMVEAGANEIPEAEILDALDIAHDAIKKLCAAQHELREKAGKPKVEVEVGGSRRGARSRRSRPRSAAKLDEATSVFDKLERQDASKAVIEAIVGAVRRRPRRRGLRREARQRQGGREQAGEGDHPRAHRRPQEAPRRPLREGDPADLDRDRRASAHPRLGAVHARPDAGGERRRPRHAQGGDAPRHARPADQQVLLAPLQLPALLGRGGRSHGRPQAP